MYFKKKIGWGYTKNPILWTLLIIVAWAIGTDVYAMLPKFSGNDKQKIENIVFDFKDGNEEVQVFTIVNGGVAFADDDLALKLTATRKTEIAKLINAADLSAEAKNAVEVLLGVAKPASSQTEATITPTPSITTKSIQQEEKTVATKKAEEPFKITQKSVRNPKTTEIYYAEEKEADDAKALELSNAKQKAQNAQEGLDVLKGVLKNSKPDSALISQIDDHDKKLKELVSRSNVTEKDYNDFVNSADSLQTSVQAELDKLDELDTFDEFDEFIED